MPADVDDEAGELETAGAHLRLRGPLAAQLGVDPRGELADLEGFGDVVVGADLERHHHVDGVGARRQDDDRDLDAGSAEPPADVEAGHARQAQVEQDEVDVALLGEAQALGAVLGELQAEAVLLGDGGEDVAHRRVVVDDEHGRLRRRADDAVTQGREDRFREGCHPFLKLGRPHQTCPLAQRSTAPAAGLPAVTDALPVFTRLQPRAGVERASHVHRERDHEGVAARARVVDPDPSAHSLDELAREIEADTESAALTEQRRLDLVEGCEDAVDVAVRDAPAVVPDLDVHLVHRAIRGDAHRLGVRERTSARCR